MDSYFDVNVQKVMGTYQKYLNWLNENPHEWRDEVDGLIMDASNNKLRVFQTFFESPSEAFSGSYVLQALEEKDMIQMYPQLLEQARLVDTNSYMYIFLCKNAGKSGNALRADTIISFPKIE